MRARQPHNRTLDYGLRMHMIVRDTEAEAKEYADYIASKLDDEYGKTDPRSGPRQHFAWGCPPITGPRAGRSIWLHRTWTMDRRWSGTLRLRRRALVGSTDQVISKIESYQKMGIPCVHLLRLPTYRRGKTLWQPSHATPQNRIPAPCIRTGSI